MSSGKFQGTFSQGGTGPPRRGRGRPRSKYKEASTQTGAYAGGGNQKYKKEGQVVKVTNKALTGKIDTALEKRMQEIAEAEIRKNLIRLCFRLYCFGTYTNATGVFDAGTNINFTGKTVNIGRIIKCQVEQKAVVAAAANDPLTTNVDETNVMTGDPILAVSKDMHGRRLGDSVMLTGIAITIKARMPENASQPAIEESRLMYNLVSVYDDWETVGLASDPTIPQLLRIYPFGYSPLLDKVEDVQHTRRKLRFLEKGTHVFRAHDAKPYDATISIYHEFKNPVLYEFHPEDQNGTRPLKLKYFLTLRSNIPDANDKNIFPNVHVCTKMYYNQ